MRVLVTGYGGFLGAAICRHLIAAGYQVRGLARGSYPELERIGVQSVRGSVSSAECCLDACDDCDAVIHTAAKAGVWGKWNEYYLTNTLATQHLLDAASRKQVKAFVYTSSPSVTFDGRHQSGVEETVAYPQRWLCHYPHTKALAEQLVAQYARTGRLLTCSLRPHLIWGHGDPHLFPRVIQRACSGRLRCVGSGKNLIDVVHVDNAARAHLLALQKLLEESQQLNGQALFITDGQPVPQRKLSFSAAYRIGAALEVVYKLTGRSQEPPMTRFVAAQLALDHYFSIDRARQLIDYQPQTDLDDEWKRCEPWLQQLARK